MTDVWTELGQRIRSIARSEARGAAAASTTRWKVVSTAPLRIVSLSDPADVLEDGEEDVDVAHGLSIAKGDVVVVHEDSAGDYVVASVVKT
jgi:hypothetical protein